MAYNIFERWPFTSFQNLNLDWLMNATKEAVETANEAADSVGQFDARITANTNAIEQLGIDMEMMSGTMRVLVTSEQVAAYNGQPITGSQLRSLMLESDDLPYVMYNGEVYMLDTVSNAGDMRFSMCHTVDAFNELVIRHIMIPAQSSNVAYSITNVSAGGGGSSANTVTVTITDRGDYVSPRFLSDHSYAEISSAIQNGKAILLNVIGSAVHTTTASMLQTSVTVGGQNRGAFLFLDPAALNSNSPDIHYYVIREDGEIYYLQRYNDLVNMASLFANAVSVYPQNLTEAQKVQARENIGCLSDSDLPYVTPEMYGAKGDGVADDTAALQAAIDSGFNVICYKTYRVTSKITNTNGISLELTQGAVIKLDSVSVIDCMFELTHGYSGIGYNGRICGNGTIDGNYKCNTLIGLNNFSSFLISDIFAQNFLSHGIESRYNDSDHSANYGGALTVRKVRIRNINSPQVTAYGVYDNGNDNVYENCVVCDCQVGFRCGNSIFKSCHHWLSDKNLFSGSVSFSIAGKTPMLNNVISDTVQTAILMGSNSSAVVDGLEMFTNSSVVDSTDGNSLGFLVFNVNTSSRLTASNIILMFPATYTNVKFVPDSFFNSGNYVTNFKYDNVICDNAPLNLGDRFFANATTTGLTELDNLSVGMHSAYCNSNQTSGMVEGWSIILIYPNTGTAADISTTANAVIINLLTNRIYHAFKRNGTWGTIS